VDIVYLKDFTETPGGRYARQHDGPGYSGEEFRQQVLEPAWIAALEAKKPFLVDLDGTAGLPGAFIDEAFGGLVERFCIKTYSELMDLIKIKCDTEPYILEDIEESITDRIAIFNRRSIH
jgi:hypothetical protein